MEAARSSEAGIKSPSYMERQARKSRILLEQLMLNACERRRSIIEYNIIH